MTRIAPLAAVVAALAWVILGVRKGSPGPDGPAIGEFARIPVQHDGRIMPLDTVARNMLRAVAERESFEDEKGVRQPAARWLLDVMADFTDSSGRARKHKVFRIVNSEIRDPLGLEGRSGYRYAIEEFGKKLPALGTRVIEVQKRSEEGQSLDAHDRQLLAFERKLRIFEALASFKIPRLVPPKAGSEDWLTLEAAVENPDPTVQGFLNGWRAILQAHGRGDASAFNDAVRDHLGALEASGRGVVDGAGLEARFNHLDPFGKCEILYLVVLVLGALGWIGWARTLNRTSYALLALAFMLHTGALITRIYLSGKPPVTNLYATAIFIGWGCVFIGLIIEGFFPLGLASVAAAFAGFGTLLISPILAADSDTMAVLQAVLDTQFWLSTHVVCITLGYATTYFSGLLGSILILKGALTRSLAPEARLVLARTQYGVLCFATFFSFVGTVLGGLWADDSWGRFWGWDPKENGALMIVLWNALVLHARWGGIARDRGLAVLAVAGNIIVTWSWFGTNLLGKGLHAYGFNDRLFWLVIGIVAGHAAIGALGCLPQRLWRSPAGPAGAHAASR